MKFLLAILLALSLSACKEDTGSAEIPAPASLNAEAAGYYCQMNILEHDGPKGQIFLAGLPAPLWFSQVRDGLAYVLSPEQEGEILVLYVNDMGKAASWSEPGEDNWIMAQDAYYVVGSDARGGMGAPEIVPFGEAAAAAEFAASRGGEVLRMNDITAEIVLAPVDFDPATLETNE